MNNKINTSDLVEMLVETYDRKLANNFVKEFQKTIIDGLERDQIVKINGLGTFKLTLIAERKSVNVQTGEAIIIPQHYKVSFVADNTIKTRLNTISSDTEKIDPLKKMAEQANEINDILKDFNNNPNKEKNSTENENKKEENEKQEINTTTTKIEEPIKKSEKTPAGKNYKWLIWISLICLLLMILGFVYYLYSEDINKLFQSEEPTIIEEVSEEKETEPKAEVEESVFTQPIDYSETIATETIRKGTRLAFFAKQYYGHPDFWIYIYEANKEIIENPSNILIGTQVNIPKLPAELIDTTNEEAINHAIDLAKKIKK